MTEASTTGARAHRLLIFALSAANFAVGMGAFVVIGVLTPVAESFALTEAQAGWMMTAYALAYAVGSPTLVALTGGMARRTVLAIGLGTVTAAILATALAPSAGFLFAMRVLTGVGAGLITPVAAGVAAAASPPEQRGKALAAAFFGLTLAQVLGVPVGAWIGYTFGWEVVFLLNAALCFAALVAILMLVPGDMPFQVNSLATLGAALSDLKTVLAIMFTALIMGAVYVFYTYVAPVLETRMGFSRDGVSLFLLAFGVGAVFGNLLGGYLTDRIGAYRTLIFVAVSQIVLLPVYSILPLAEWLLYAHAVLWAVCGWSFAASQQFRLISLAPERQNVMLALNAAAIYVGVSLGAWIGGAVLEAAGLDALGYAGAGVAVLALAVLVLSERARR
ncbi:MAG: MFS transporter [Pseudomonadota bacterium]